MIKKEKITSNLPKPHITDVDLKYLKNRFISLANSALSNELPSLKTETLEIYMALDIRSGEFEYLDFYTDNADFEYFAKAEHLSIQDDKDTIYEKLNGISNDENYKFDKVYFHIQTVGYWDDQTIYLKEEVESYLEDGNFSKTAKDMVKDYDWSQYMEMLNSKDGLLYTLNNFLEKLKLPIIEITEDEVKDKLNSSLEENIENFMIEILEEIEEDLC